MKTLIAYHSDYEHTQAIARAVSAGVTAACSTSDTVITQQISELKIESLKNADVIIFGSPVHMGSMAWQMKRFIDDAAALWMEGALEGKVAGAFVSSGGFGGAGGGAEHALIGLHSNALEHGMITVGFPKSLPGYAEAGLQWGLAVRTGDHEGMPQAVQEAQLLAARSYGAHVCKIAGLIHR